MAACALILYDSDIKIAQERLVTVKDILAHDLLLKSHLFGGVASLRPEEHSLMVETAICITQDE